MRSPDHGLHYELAAVLGEVDALTAMARVHPSARVVPLDVEPLALLPVTAELAAEVTPAALCSLGMDRLPGGTELARRCRDEWLTGPESGFHVLTPGVAALVEAGSVISTVAYVEADYLGREGRQAAAVWRAGVLVTGPLLLGRQEAFTAGTAPISVALRALGVAGAGRRDEFVVAGLGRRRHTEDWADGGG
ncbi:MAG TPA: hypothetical protein VNP92_18245 [Actinophytocola sp.]|nr:hypothetical protein [Actinophytocola sp.]